MSGTLATSAVAVMGPIPGIVCNRFAASVGSAARQLFFVSASIRSRISENWSASRCSGTSAAAGRSVRSRASSSLQTSWTPFGATTPNAPRCARSALATRVTWRTRTPRALR